VDGAVVAIPEALLGTAVQALLGRHREPAPEQDTGDQRHTMRVTATVLLTLTAVVLATAVVGAPTTTPVDRVKRTPSAVSTNVCRFADTPVDRPRR
jgi:hypothetical protein